MRKKTVTHSVKTIFWWLLYLLPVICYVLVVKGFARNGTDFVPFGTYMSSSSFGFASNITIALIDLFGQGGILPLFGPASGVLHFASYFISMNLLHLAVDFILFIPRLCHKFMNKFTRSDDGE